MKIVKRGKNPKEVPFKLTCRKCETVVELKQTELKRMQGDRPSDPDSDYCVCPVCSEYIFDSQENRNKSKDYLD